MPRKKIVQDDELLLAARRVLARVGPAGVTVEKVAQETGLAKATLLQRFGSKRGLMLALAEQGTAMLRQRFAEALKQEGSPLARLIDLFSARSGIIGKPEQLAGQLMFLPTALGDKDFRKLAVEQARLSIAGAEELIAAAVAAKELLCEDIHELAQLIHVTYNGALLTWVVLQKGKVQDSTRASVEAVLRPYRARRGRHA